LILLAMGCARGESKPHSRASIQRDAPESNERGAPMPKASAQPTQNVGDDEIRRDIVRRALEDFDRGIGPGLSEERRRRAEAIENEFYRTQGGLQTLLADGKIDQAEMNRRSHANAVTKAKAYEAILSDGEYQKLFGYRKGSVR
jgi:hypothetical protein